MFNWIILLGLIALIISPNITYGSAGLYGCDYHDFLGISGFLFGILIMAWGMRMLYLWHKNRNIPTSPYFNQKFRFSGFWIIVLGLMIASFIYFTPDYRTNLDLERCAGPTYRFGHSFK